MFSCPWFLFRPACWPCRAVTGFLLLLHDIVLDPELQTESPGCLKDKAPPVNFEHFIIMLDHKQQYFLLAITLLCSLILYCCLELQQNIRSLDFLHFYLFTYMKFNKCVSYFILHIHTIRYTSKGKEAGCCQAHHMQTAPIISNDSKLLPSHSHSVLNLTALGNHLHSPSFTSALTEVLAIKDCNYLKPSWGQVIDIGKPRAQILFPRA